MATDLDNYLLSNENKERCIKELEETSFLFQFANKKSRETTAQSSRSAAILIPLISSSEFEGGVGLLYTKRSPLLRAHPRQDCSAGGIINPSETPNEAASRESNEELGINSSQIDIWTCMPELLGSVRDEGFTSVIPVVGEVKNFEPKSLVVNKDEVYDYFVKGVYELHNHNIAGYTQFRHWKNPNSKPGYSLPIYNCKPYPIWGVTALITLQFLSVFLKGRTKGFNHAINFQTPSI